MMRDARWARLDKAAAEFNEPLTVLAVGLIIIDALVALARMLDAVSAAR